MNAEHEPAPESASEQAAAAGFGGLAEAIGARNLKIAIVSMPLVFIAAIALVIAIFGKPGAKRADDAVAASPAASAVAAQPSAPIALQDGEVIRSLTLDGDRLAATVDGPNGSVIVIYDIAKGAEIARIPVAQD